MRKPMPQPALAGVRITNAISGVSRDVFIQKAKDWLKR